MEITRSIFEAQQKPRFGASNPERMPLAFWEWMVSTSEESRLRDWSDREDIPAHTPYQLRVRFGQEGDYSKGPVWNFDRMGATRTPHPDGRVICIGGEHEDFYDPDFCIYNDVVVLDLDGSIEIYGYPQEVFPPTDFHTATLVGDRVIVIGRLGYRGERHPGTTPVMVLDLATYRFEPLPSHGEVPGWIFRHEAELSDGTITIRGGEVIDEPEARTRRNFDDFAYDIATGAWRKLTNRRWRQFEIRDAEGKHYMRGPRFRGCCPTDDEPWKCEPVEEPEDDVFVYLMPEALFPARIEYDPVYSEEFSLEERILVGEIPVSITMAGSIIEIVIEGDMSEAEATGLVEDIRSNIEADTGRTCVVQAIT